MLTEAPSFVLRRRSIATRVQILGLGAVAALGALGIALSLRSAGPKDGHWPESGGLLDSPERVWDPGRMQFAREGTAGAIVGAVERVAGRGRAQVAAHVHGSGRRVCIVVNAPGRYCELDVGMRAEDLPWLKTNGFRAPPVSIAKTMSIYRSVAARAMGYSTERGDRIIVLLCPAEEWPQTQPHEPAARPADAAQEEVAAPVAQSVVRGDGIAIGAVTIVEPADPDSVPKYSKVEFLVELHNVAATEFYDPDPASGGIDLSATFTSPNAEAWQVNGFYDGSGWRIRFAPDRIGAWSYSVRAEDPSGLSNTVTGSFTCVGSPYHGWARIRGHWLRFTDGHALFAVGHNTGWQPYVEQPPLAQMAAKGESLLSFWIAMPWARPSWTSPAEPYWDDRAPIENTEGGIGNYNQAACAYIDRVVARAEAAGVYLLPTIWSHAQLRGPGHPWGQGWWDDNAYSSVCAAPEFFETSDANGVTPQWRYQKNFYRYLIARWGHSRAIAGWVLACEIDGTSGYYEEPAQAEAWCGEVRDYFAANDGFRCSSADEYPLAVSKLDEPGWNNGLDLRTTDSYAQQASDVDVANIIAEQTGTMWSSDNPCFHAEFGGNTVQGASQPAHLHNGIWAGSAAGAAMTPLVWCDGGSFPMLTPAMQDQLQHVSQFMAGTDFVGSSALAPASVSVTGGSCRGWGMKLADRGFAWIQNTGGNVDGKTLTVLDLAPGGYAVSWYDVWTSGAVPVRTDAVTVGLDGSLAVTVPSLARADVACRFVRTSASDHLLAVNSRPIIGLAIAGDPAGTTDYLTPVTAGAMVSLTAPLEAGGLHFLQWQDGEGGLISQEATIEFPMNADATVVAIFGQKIQLALAEGWNLISIPVEPLDPARDAVFPPEVIAAAWGYQNPGGYVVPLEIHPKKGYWVLALSAATLEIEGIRPSDTSVEVNTGWNLIGVVESEPGVPQPLPPTPPMDAIWQYDNPGGYAVPTECSDEHGFWLLASQDDTIWNGGGAAPGASSRCLSLAAEGEWSAPLQLLRQGGDYVTLGLGDVRSRPAGTPIPRRLPRIRSACGSAPTSAPIGQGT